MPLILEVCADQEGRLRYRDYSGAIHQPDIVHEGWYL